MAESEQPASQPSEHGEILAKIVSGGSQREILTMLAYLLETQVKGALVAILLVDTDQLGAQISAAPSLPPRFRAALERQVGNAQLAGLAAAPAAAQLTLTPDLALDPAWERSRAEAAAAGLTSAWAMPVLDGEAQLLGQLLVHLRGHRAPSAAEARAVADAALWTAVVVGYARVQESLVGPSQLSAISALPNRAVFLDRLRLAHERVRRGHADYFAVIQLAIEGVAQLNETLGPTAGDEVLRLAARRLSSVTGPSATLAHVWGVEFAILLEDLADSEQATAVATAVQDACGEPFDVEGVTVTVSTTIGVAAYSAQTATAAMPDEEPLRAARAAKERAKTSGTGRIGIYDPVTGADAVTLAPELRRGIDENQLTVAYQPIVELASAEVHRYEALLRWSSPVRGAIPPDTFVPVAEASGLVADLGRYALREGLAELARLREGDPGMGMSVNVSVRQLADELLPVVLAELLREHELPRGSVTLEVTEGVLLGSGAAGWRVLAELRELGARIALDDFGTGYSQLSYLRQFRFDEIKIDQSFVRSMDQDLAARAIIVGVIAVADYLDCEVVAEGIEHPEQRQLLLELGCSHGQGYLFGAPRAHPRDR